MSDQPVSEAATYTTQQTQQSNIHALKRDSNPQFQQSQTYILDCTATDWSTGLISISWKEHVNNKMQDSKLPKLAYFCNSKG
jgi:hypothetical protein